MPRRSAVDPISALRHGGFLLYLIGGLDFQLRQPDADRGGAVGDHARENRIRASLRSIWAYIGLALVLPVILFALPAGAAADRFSRRWLIVIAQAGTGRVRRRAGVGVVDAGAAARSCTCCCSERERFARLGWPASTAIVTGLVPAKDVFQRRDVAEQRVPTGVDDRPAGGRVSAWRGGAR